jgi:SAM-dependent methyltransferase
MRQVSCPVCNSLPTFSPKINSIYLCSTCGTRWTFIPEELNSDELYSDEVYAVVDNRKSLFEKIIFSEAKKILKKVERLNPHAKTLLDFGAGKGQFLAVAQEKGWEGLGVETASERACFAREKYGVNVLEEFYTKGQIKRGNFHLITLNHVLEHLPQPLDLLSELANQNLTKNGILYIEVPRADSWQAKIAGSSWIHWDIPKHLSHWTEEGLVDQMRKIGFNRVDTRKYSVHLGVLGMLQALLSKLGFRENLIFRLKRKKSLALILTIGLVLPFAWISELISLPFGKSGILGVYFQKDA